MFLKWPFRFFQRIPNNQIKYLLFVINLDSKDLSPSVASFEELQGVINFLSGSSSSSLAINEKCDKLRHSVHILKRTISSTSLQNEHKTNKVIPEGKKKLTHKRSASFSGADLKEVEIQKVEQETLKTPSVDDIQYIRKSFVAADVASNNYSDVLLDVPKTERTPGDGMDQRLDKNACSSAANFIASDDSLTNMLSSADQHDLNTSTVSSQLYTNCQSNIQDSNENDSESAHEYKNLSVQIESTSPLPDWFDQDPSTGSLTQEGISMDTMNLLPAKGISPFVTSNMNSIMNMDDFDKIDIFNLKIGERVPKTIFPTTAASKTEVERENTRYSISCNQPEEIRENRIYGASDGVSATFLQNESIFSGTLQNYQPFNSNTSWPIGLQSSSLSTLWSDATLEKEKVIFIIFYFCAKSLEFKTVAFLILI